LDVVPHDPALATHRVGAVPSGPAPAPLAIHVSATAGIRGVLRGSNGAGVAGIAIHAFAVRLEEPGAHYGRSRHALTAADGSFELPHLPRGLYRLRWPANP